MGGRAEEVDVDVPKAGEEDWDGCEGDGGEFRGEKGESASVSYFCFVNDNCSILDRLAAAWDEERGFDTVEFGVGSDGGGREAKALKLGRGIGVQLMLDG